MLAVETCVAAYARKFGEDEEKWSMQALLHDFDWEIHRPRPIIPLKASQSSLTAGLTKGRHAPQSFRTPITAGSRASPKKRFMAAMNSPVF